MGSFDAIFKAYDIRGIYPDQIDAYTCHAIGAAFARWCVGEGEAKEVLVARDMRPSGPELVAAFGAGVRSQGLDVIDLGETLCIQGLPDSPGKVGQLLHPRQLNGTICDVAFSFIVQLPSGIMEKFRERSLFSSIVMYRSISVSLWWILKTGWVRI